MCVVWVQVRLGDLKPQRLLYLRLKHLAPKGGAGQAQGNGTPRAHGNGISANGDGINGDANSNDIDGNANGVDERASPQQASLQRFSQGMSACCDPLEQDPSALRPLGSTSTSFADPGAGRGIGTLTLNAPRAPHTSKLESASHVTQTLHLGGAPCCASPIP